MHHALSGLVHVCHRAAPKLSARAKKGAMRVHPPSGAAHRAECLDQALGLKHGRATREKMRYMPARQGGRGRGRGNVLRRDNR